MKPFSLLFGGLAADYSLNEINSFQYDLNEFNNDMDRIYSSNFTALEREWDGVMIKDEEFPDHAIRVKEPKLCEDVKQVSYNIKYFVSILDIWM